MKHLNIIVLGLVQGVSFRAFTRQQAKRLGISGFVQNLPDGSVRLEAEGQPAQLQALIECLREGPPAARVNDLEISEGNLKQLSGFTIEPG